LFINFDWTLLLFVILLCGIGILLIYSATSGPYSEVKRGLYIKQIYWILFGLIAMLLVMSIDYRQLARWSPLFYVFNLLMLGYVLYTSSSNVKRWIRFGGINIQPSEFTKLCIILLLAQFFKEKKLSDISLKNLLWASVLTLIPIFLILKQPDLGTAVILVPILLALFYIAGFRVRWLLMIIGIGTGLGPPFLWLGLKSYQKNRILSFINPNLDPLGAGYQVTQSKIAVGSGGLWGHGFLCGTQCRLKFIPQHHTDFIFSLLAEEWGLLGSIIMLGLFLFFLLKGFDICAHAKDRLGMIISYSILVSIALHIIINVGMVIGIMPVTGIPLPFVSYGGSAIVGNFIAVGLLQNIAMRRFE
jgi:rod shape determining protein RodA